MNCKKCNAILNQGQRFCVACGEKVEFVLQRSIMKYEYFTSVFSIDYQKAMGSGLLNKSTEYDPFWPEWRSLPDNPKYKSHMEEMGQKGWELVSVQPILRGIYRSYNESAYGYSLTAGYYFFWKKQLSE